MNLKRTNGARVGPLCASSCPKSTPAPRSLRHAIDAHSGGGNDRTIVFVRHIVHADGRREIEGVTPKQLPAPASPALPRPTDPTDDTNEGAV
jgi:hypothetical protein